MKIQTASFDHYELKNGEFLFHYSWDDKFRFTHRLIIPKQFTSHNIFMSSDWELWAFHIGLSRFPFYFAPAAPTQVQIKAGLLEPAALELWQSWYNLGLAEFNYKNGLPLEIQLSNPAKNRPSVMRFKAPLNNIDDHYIVLHGGGKDSAVTGEVLNELKIDFTWFVLGMNNTRKIMIKNSPQKKFIKLSGKADALRNEIKQKNNLYKGHKPLSLYLAFTSAFIAELSESNYIIASNEKSANYGNLNFHGVKINHQYTKSYQFESEFANYIKVYLSPRLSYFSLLRPLYELQILKIFSNLKQYHNTFISCNNTIHESRWCGRCSKCAFIYLGLYPFMNTEHLGRIIGKNMLADIDLLPRYLALTGVSGHKPFECVGTIEENMAAMYLASLKPNPPLNVKYFMKNVPQLARARQNVDKIMNNYDNTNLIPRQLSTKIPSVFNNWLK